MEKKTWTDIPSLEGLEMEWDFQPQGADGNRAYKRMTARDLSQLFGGRPVEVKVATLNDTLSGSLHDLCEGGMAINIATRLDENQHIKVGMVLGREKIIASAKVRHVQGHDQKYTAGLMFIGLDPTARRYIAGIYGSKVLGNTL